MRDLAQEEVENHARAVAVVERIAPNEPAPKADIVPKGYAYVDRLPKASCRRCHGRGTNGKDESNGIFEPCRCLGVVSKKRKRTYMVTISETGWVTETALEFLPVVQAVQSGAAT